MDHDLIFPSSVGTPFSKTELQKGFAKLFMVANLRRIRFHDLRLTAASPMLNHGVKALLVSKILVHSNPSVTLTIYAYSTLAMQSEAARIMEELISPIPVSIRNEHDCQREPELYEIRENMSNSKDGKNATLELSTNRSEQGTWDIRSSILCAFDGWRTS